MMPVAFSSPACRRIQFDPSHTPSRVMMLCPARRSRRWPSATSRDSAAYTPCSRRAIPTPDSRTRLASAGSPPGPGSGAASCRQLLDEGDVAALERRQRVAVARRVVGAQALQERSQHSFERTLPAGHHGEVFTDTGGVGEVLRFDPIHGTGIVTAQGHLLQGLQACQVVPQRLHRVASVLARLFARSTSSRIAARDFMQVSIACSVAWYSCSFALISLCSVSI